VQFFGKSEANTSLEHPKLGERENIRVHLNEMGGDVFEWIYLAGAKSSG
jgi:hypothetical protein